MYKDLNNCFFIEKTLIFWEHPFSEKYSNGPVIVKKWHMSSVNLNHLKSTTEYKTIYASRF